MTHYIKYRLALQQLYLSQDRIRREYEKSMREAKASESKDGIEEIRISASQDDDIIQDKINMLVTRYVRRQAERLFLSVSDEPDMWTQCRMHAGHSVLTPKAITNLRAAINSSRRDSFSILLQLVSLAVGLIGALTGLISVLYFHH
jgi:hypothetical protein